MGRRWLLAQITRYLVAVLAVVLAVLANAMLWAQIKPQVSPLFIAAVMISAWYGGLGPGLLATALAGFASIWFFMEPAYSMHVDLADALRLGVFFLVAILISSLNAQKHRAQLALQAAHDTLESRVFARTGELSDANRALQEEIQVRRQTEQQLIAYQRQLRHLAAELSRTEEKQRQAFASRLHDDIGQLLSLIAMRLQLVQDRPAGNGDPSLADIRELVDQAIARTRTLTCELSPPVLHQLGLEPALAWLADQVGASNGLRVRFEPDPHPKPLPPELRIFLFQAVRELLTNVVKHAQASTAVIHLRRDGNLLRAMVADDGVGFDPAGLWPDIFRRNCFGLFNIQERLKQYNGELIVESAPGEGARFTVVIALPREASSDE